MACGGLRGTSLSTDTNFNAGQNVSNRHIPRHWLYVMLCGVFHFSFVCFNNFFVAFGVKTLTQ